MAKRPAKRATKRAAKRRSTRRAAKRRSTRRVHRVNQRGGWDGDEGSRHYVISARGVKIDGGIVGEKPYRDEKSIGYMGGFEYALVTYVDMDGDKELDVNCGFKLQTFLSHHRNNPARFPPCAEAEQYWTSIDNIVIFADPDNEWYSGVLDVTEIGSPEVIYNIDRRDEDHPYDPNGLLDDIEIDNDGDTRKAVRLGDLINVIKEHADGEGASGEEGHPDIYIHVLTSFA